jgi:hypothetical protein
MVWETGDVKREFVRGRLIGEIVKYKVENVTTVLRPWTENGEFALIDESAISGISGFEPPYFIDFNSRRGRLGDLD